MHVKLAYHIYRMGARWRNPSLWTEYERLKESEWLPLASLLELQAERARSFLRFANDHSQHYRRVFAEAGFRPGRYENPSSLAVLPTVRKADLVANNDEIHTRVDHGRTFLAETSGTTGGALGFRKDERWDSTVRAHLMRAYDWYGVSPWERHGYLWGYDIAASNAWKTATLDMLQNRFRIFSYDPPSVRRFARRLRGARFLAGYSSMVYEVARMINREGMDPPELALVKGTSEMVLDVYQGEAVKAFGRRIVSEYGAAEAGLIAFECPSGRMHVNVEDVILEVGPDGGVLVTNLVSRSFPIVRYELGDAVVLSDAPCPCGRAHPVISEVVGRKGASVVGRTTRFPALTFYYVFKNLALNRSILLNYKARQERVGEVTLYIEDPGDRGHEAHLRAELLKYFRDEVDVDIRYVGTFERGRRKAQYFESEL